MPQQSTNNRTYTDTSWDLHFCIASSIIIGKTTTEVTDTINGEISQMACRRNLQAFRPKQICDEREPSVLIKNIYTSHIANGMRHFHLYTFLSTNIPVITHFLKILLTSSSVI